jgi:hypothetical protein
MLTISLLEEAVTSICLGKDVPGTGLKVVGREEHCSLIRLRREGISTLGPKSLLPYIPWL